MRIYIIDLMIGISGIYDIFYVQNSRVENFKLLFLKWVWNFKVFAYFM